MSRFVGDYFTFLQLSNKRATMVYVLCSKEIATNAIEQSMEVSTNLQCMLLHLYAEQARSNTAVKKRKRLIRNKPLNSFEYFLSDGIICLGATKRFYNWNRNSRELFWLLIRNIDIYTRLKNKLTEIQYNKNRLLRRQNIYDSNFIIISEDIIDENNQYMNVNDILEFEADELIDFYTWINKIPDRIGLMIGMEHMLNLIQDAFFKICSSLYQALNKYCKKLRQYLYNNKDTLKSSKFYSDKHSIQFRYRYTCCKYHFLKQLLELISEQEKHIAKYILISEK